MQLKQITKQLFLGGGGGELKGIGCVFTKLYHRLQSTQLTGSLPCTNDVKGFDMHNRLDRTIGYPTLKSHIKIIHIENMTIA